tara:strand:- start:3849 stop:4037 length:189 start_codon:yes stop_codon:yes gene_type:complete
MLKKLIKKDVYEHQGDRKDILQNEGVIFAKMFGAIIFLCLLYLPLLQIGAVGDRLEFIFLTP